MLLLKKHGEGWLSRWHGRFKVGGKTREVALCRWKGVPPASGRIGKDKGDSVFEASRQRALEELKQIAEGGRSEADKAAAAERVYRARYEHRAKRGSPAPGRRNQRPDAMPLPAAHSTSSRIT